MLPHPPKHHRLTELDIQVLLTPYRVQTNWHVITGAPCSGKSTLIGQLASRGYQTIPESARVYIEEQMAKGQSTHPIRTNPAVLQRNIKVLQQSVEDGLPAEATLFLDGALPGSLAWYRVYGLDPNEILPDCFRHRYASVFSLAPLPFRSDGERVEEMVAIAGYLDLWQTRDYAALGYSLVRVPALPPEERLNYVLEHLPGTQ